MAKPNPNAPVGSGGRFAALKGNLSRRKDIQDPGALASFIGRKRYGKKKFQSFAAKGKASSY